MADDGHEKLTLGGHEADRGRSWDL